MSVSAPMKQIWKCMTEGNRFNQVLKKVTLVSAGDGSCKAEMTVGEEHANDNGTLHGGMTSTIVDIISTLALTTHKVGAQGVSVDLHVTFLKAAPIGEQIVIEAKTNRAGRTLAFLDVAITNKTTGALIARGSHTKFVGAG